MVLFALHLFYDDISDGTYHPVYLRYGGDILRSRITPIYYIEAGYAAHPKKNLDNEKRESFGGPIGTIGFGVNFNTKRRINFNLSLNLNYRRNYFRLWRVYYNQYGKYYQLDPKHWDNRLFGQFVFGVGF